MGQKWSRVNFVTIFVDLYKIKLWGICTSFNQFAHLNSASDPINDVIKMAVYCTIILRMYLRKIKECWQNARFLIDLMPLLL